MGGLVIGIWPNPEASPRWQTIRALLQPAADYDDGVIKLVDRLVWVASDGDDILAVATTRLTTDGCAEIELVGGRGWRRWLQSMDEVIGHWARGEGAKALQARGRAAWGRINGWTVIDTDGRISLFERVL